MGSISDEMMKTSKQSEPTMTFLAKTTICLLFICLGGWMKAQDSDSILTRIGLLLDAIDTTTSDLHSWRAAYDDCPFYLTLEEAQKQKHYKAMIGARGNSSYLSHNIRILMEIYQLYDPMLDTNHCSLRNQAGQEFYDLHWNPNRGSEGMKNPYVRTGRRDFRMILESYRQWYHATLAQGIIKMRSSGTGPLTGCAYQWTVDLFAIPWDQRRFHSHTSLLKVHQNISLHPEEAVTYLQKQFPSRMFTTQQAREMILIALYNYHTRFTGDCSDLRIYVSHGTDPDSQETVPITASELSELSEILSKSSEIDGRKVKDPGIPLPTGVMEIYFMNDPSLRK